MTQTRSGSSGDRRREDRQERPPDSDEHGDDGVEAATAWVATTAVRTGLTLIGVVLLLFALGQAVGLPLLQLVSDALTSQTGQWLVVAFFAVLLIGASRKGVPSG